MGIDQRSAAANGRCCVFQPFDKGPFDKRYDHTIAPAIEGAKLEPYRVDRDDGVLIPIETLHEQIRSATICLADISTQNPNVMYDLGFAIASGKDVVLICPTEESERFPFDIQHRGIIQYVSDSARDFEKLKNDITRRIEALLKKQITTQEIASASPIKSTHGLQPNEVAALAFVLANADGVGSGVSGYVNKNRHGEGGIHQEPDSTWPDQADSAWPRGALCGERRLQQHHLCGIPPHDRGRGLVA